MIEKKLMQYAEVWWKEQGNQVPKRGSLEWHRIFQRWVDCTFPPKHPADRQKRSKQ